MKLKSFALVLALAALGTGAAQARSNVAWSVGIAAAPGITVGVGNVAPVYVAPAPVYLAPQPVYVAPPPVVLVRPAPVYYAPVYYGPPGHYRHRHYRGAHWH